MQTVKLLFLRILRKLNLLSKFNFTLSRKINGEKITIPFINGFGFVNFTHKKNWLDILIQGFVKSEKGMFVDVGVNIGQTLLRIKTLMPEVHYLGFEPNSTCTFYTQQLIKENKLEDCMVYNCALSEKVQNIVLEKSLADDKRASIVSSLRPNSFTDSEYVLAVNFDALEFREKVSFIKIDVEGAEYEVLSGMEQMLKRDQPIITCEVLDSHAKEELEFTQKRADLVFEMLSSLDYSIIQLKTSKRGIKSYKKLDGFEIKQWTIDSSVLNDYVFYPTKKEKEVLSILKAIN